THAAIAGDRQAGMPAVVRDLDAESVGGLDDGRPVLDLDPAAVDLNRGHGRAALARRGTGSGRAWHAARTPHGTWWRTSASAWRHRPRGRRWCCPGCCRPRSAAGPRRRVTLHHPRGRAARDRASLSLRGTACTARTTRGGRT